MKTMLKLLLIGILLSLIYYVGQGAYFLWNLDHPSPTANFSLIQSITGVRFPLGITQYAEFDDVLGYVTAHLKLPPNEIQSFIKQHHFITIDPMYSLSDRDVSHLSTPFNKIPNSVNYMLRGDKGVHSWHFVLDSRSGNLWLKVWFPGGI